MQENDNHGLSSKALLQTLLIAFAIEYMTIKWQEQRLYIIHMLNVHSLMDFCVDCSSIIGLNSVICWQIIGVSITSKTYPMYL